MQAFFEYKSTILHSNHEKRICTFPLHMHSHTEFLYINEGETILKTPSGDYTLKQGDIAVIFPYQIHGYKTISTEDESEYTLAICSEECLGDFKKIFETHHPENPVIFSRYLSNDVPAIMSELATLNARDDQRILIKSLIGMLLARIAPSIKLKHNDANFDGDIVTKAIIFILENFTKDIDAETVAKELGISRYSLSRLFSNRIGISFTGYIRYLRVDFARALLKTTQKQVSEIAEIVGYDCLRSFNRDFKEILGITPKKYQMHR